MEKYRNFAVGMMKKRVSVYIVTLMVAVLSAMSLHAQEARLLYPHPAAVVTHDGERMCRVECEECNGFDTRAGAAELPVYRETFWGGAGTHVELLSDSVSIMDVPGKIMRVSPSVVKGREEEVRHEDVEDTWKLINLRLIGRRGEDCLWQLVASPIEYDEDSDRIIIHHLRYRLDIAPVANTKQARRPKYEIVAPGTFEPALLPLAEWRRQCGYEVGMTYADNRTPDSLRRILREESPDYVLIVGDLGEVGSFSGRHNIVGLNGHYADLYYGEYTNDYIPEAMVGRLPVSDTNTLKDVVAKILEYEQQADDEASQQSLIVAGEEGLEPAPTTTNGQLNYVAERLSTLVDTLCFRNPESRQNRDSIVAALRQGFAIVNYTSHCDTYGWKRPDLTIDDLDTANLHIGLWINNCCESNRFAGDCFGEQLLRRPDGGAAGVIGAGDETLWTEDYLWSVGAQRPALLHPIPDPEHQGAFDQLVSRQAATFGEILFAGNMAVSESGSVNDAFYWEVYCLIGDPASPVRMGAMSPITLDHDSISVGIRSLEVSTESGAVVTVMQNSRLTGRAVAAADGLALIVLSEPTDTSRVVVTATKPGRIPYIDTCTPVRVAGARLTHSILNPDNTISVGSTDTLRVRITNIGGTTAGDGRILLRQDTSQSENLCLDEQEITIDSLAPGESDTITIPITIRETDSRYLSLQIGVGDTIDGFIWADAVWEVDQPEISLSLQLKKAGTQTCSLMPNEDYQLCLTATNLGRADCMRRLSIAIRMQPDPWVQVKDTMVALDAGDSVTIVTGLTTHNPILGLEAAATMESDSITAWWQAGVASETFEEGFHYPWSNTSLTPWRTDSTLSHNGRWSMRSGAIGHSEHTDLELTVTLDRPDTLGFWMRLSTESDKDRLSFYIDNQRLYYWSGQKDWKYWKTLVPEGTHRLKWVYAKDGAGSQHEDCVWIDDIRLPFVQWDAVCGDGTQVTDTSEGMGHVEACTFELFPNPACDQFCIVSDEDIVVTIYDMTGREAASFEQRNQEAAQYSTRKLRYGTYLVKCTSSKGTSVQRLIVIR